MSWWGSIRVFDQYHWLNDCSTTRAKKPFFSPAKEQCYHARIVHGDIYNFLPKQLCCITALVIFLLEFLLVTTIMSCTTISLIQLSWTLLKGFWILLPHFCKCFNFNVLLTFFMTEENTVLALFKLSTIIISPQFKENNERNVCNL